MQSICNFITLLVLIIMIECFKVRHKLEGIEYENNRIKPSDFTL